MSQMVDWTVQRYVKKAYGAEKDRSVKRQLKSNLLDSFSDLCLNIWPALSGSRSGWLKIQSLLLLTASWGQTPRSRHWVSAGCSCARWSLRLQVQRERGETLRHVSFRNSYQISWSKWKHEDRSLKHFLPAYLV